MYSLAARFFLAEDARDSYLRNGYIGKARIIVANAIQLNNISVFNKKGIVSLSFAKFGKNMEHSYIIPSGKDAYNAMVRVVEQAIHDENCFGFLKGELGVCFDVAGAIVNEPYADGRFSVRVGDFCTLNGISTKVKSYTRDGEIKNFVAVDLPPVRDANGKIEMYKDQEGKLLANLQFEGLTHFWSGISGEKTTVNYAQQLTSKVRAKRKELLEFTLEEKIAQSKEKRSEEKAIAVPKREER